MTMLMEKREAESVRYGRSKERIMICECHLKDRDSDCVSEMIYGLSFYLYQMGNKLIFYIQEEFGYEFVVGTDILLSVSYPCF